MPRNMSQVFLWSKGVTRVCDLDRTAGEGRVPKPRVRSVRASSVRSVRRAWARGGFPITAIFRHTLLDVVRFVCQACPRMREFSIYTWQTAAGHIVRGRRRQGSLTLGWCKRHTPIAPPFPGSQGRRKHIG